MQLKNYQSKSVSERDKKIFKKLEKEKRNNFL